MVTTHEARRAQERRSLARRMQAAIAASGWSATRFAAEVGASERSAYAWLSGSRTPHRVLRSRIDEVLDAMEADAQRAGAQEVSP